MHDFILDEAAADRRAIVTCAPMNLSGHAIPSSSRSRRLAPGPDARPVGDACSKRSSKARRNGISQGRDAATACGPRRRRCTPRSPDAAVRPGARGASARGRFAVVLVDQNDEVVVGRSSANPMHGEPAAGVAPGDAVGFDHLRPRRHEGLIEPLEHRRVPDAPRRRPTFPRRRTDCDQISKLRPPAELSHTNRPDPMKVHAWALIARASRRDDSRAGGALRTARAQTGIRFARI